MTRLVLQLWLRRILLLVLAGILLVGVIFIPEGLVYRYAPQTAGEMAARIPPKRTGATWSAARYGQSLQEYASSLSTGNLYLTSDPNGDYPMAQSWIRPGERLPLLPLLNDAWLNSFGLFGLALVLGVTVGLFIGVLVVFKHWFLRSFALGFSILTLSLPDFLVVLAGQVATITVYSHYGVQLWQVLGDPTTLRGWFFPTTVLAIVPTGYVIRLTASALDEVMREDYIRTARSKGLHEAHVILGHAMRNALPRVISGLPAMINVVLSSLVVIERLTVYPGLSKWLEGAQSLAVATAGLYFVVWFILVDGMANTVRLLVSPSRQEVAWS